MSFWRTFYHLVWTTKDRAPLITPAIEPRLFAYLVHKAAELGGYTYAINGWTDHVHMVVAIPPHVAVADLVKHLKGASSHDLNQQRREEHFAWQRGYGVLTVSQRHRAIAEDYVRRQKQHHGGQTAIASLENCAEDDDGPTDRSERPRPVPALHEERPAYVVSEDVAPF